VRLIVNRPLSLTEFRFVPPDLPVDALADFLQLHWGVTGNLKPLSGERDQNFRVRTEDDTHYVLKVASPIEDPALIDFQVQALLHLEKTDPGIPVPRIVRAASGDSVETLVTADGNHPVRLLSWIDGAPMGDFDPPGLDTISQVGNFQGRICKAFEGFEHVGASHFMPWNILNGLVVTQELKTRYLRDGLAEQCGRALHRLEFDSLPRMQRLPTQIIHNDAHRGNVMCNPLNSHILTGIIDFGDLIRAPLVVDLATSLTSILERSDKPLDAVAALVRGFQTHIRLPDEQRELLYDATLARAIMTVQLLEFQVQNAEVDPDLRNIELPESKQGLRKLLCVDPDDFMQAIQNGASR
jgi:Ser/Thr protein kinase RdoA (MazF antagonist)